MPAPISARPARLLVVDDELSMREWLTIGLRREGYDVVSAKDGVAALAHLDTKPVDVVITDLNLPNVDGMELLRRVSTRPRPPQVIVVTAFATTETAVEAIGLGAYDYLIKPFGVDEIRIAVRRALERVSLVCENRSLRDALRSVRRLDGMVARSPDMHRVFELVERVAPTRTSVLIRGESGTGKELVAKALHNLSERADGPFVTVNCGAIPQALIESELFGHVKGAYSGAVDAREGAFVNAEGGTLFFDEVGDLPLPGQVNLLRALQERTIRPVGSDREIEVNCRVVAATHRDLEAAIAVGEFRNDLYFRLNVVQVVLPPLRHRHEDITLLVEHFFEHFAHVHRRTLESITPEAMEWFHHYDYPGNVLELRNIVERAVALETGGRLSADNLLGRRGSTSTEASVTHELPNDGIELDGALADFERHLICAALERAQGGRKEAARLLGISVGSLRYRIGKLGV